MFAFDSAAFANRKSAAGMALQVFDVGPGAGGGFLQRLHRPVAVFAAHELVALGEGFVDSARQPTTAYFDLALRHHRRLLPYGHFGEMLPNALNRRLILASEDQAARKQTALASEQGAAAVPFRRAALRVYSQRPCVPAASDSKQAFRML